METIMRQQLIDHCRKFMPVEQEFTTEQTKNNTMYVSHEFPGNGFNCVFAYINIGSDFDKNQLSRIMASREFLPGHHINVKSVSAAHHDQGLTKPFCFTATPLA